MLHVLRSPLMLAVLVTLANAAKPVTVDDTAYLAYARHIASDPTNPYGFTIFWWARPEQAMTVLAPPVVPYWLALGVSLFGESPSLLKLWLFPFVYVLAWALRALVVRFARGFEDFALPLLMLSPAVLPAVNLMLDVPAVALALASVELFARACRASVASLSEVGPGSLTPATEEAGRRKAWSHPAVIAICAGVCAALAMQTKYSAFVAPAAIAWYGLTHRRAGLAAVAVGVCVALFAAWELWLAEQYGRSHFWFHATASASGPAPEGQNKWIAFAGDKLALAPALASYLGCLAVGVGLLAMSALRLPRRGLVGVAVVWGIGFAMVAVLPRRWTALDPDVTAGTLFWHTSGFVWLAAVGACAVVLLVRVKKASRGARGLRVSVLYADGMPAPQQSRLALSFRLNSDTLFLVGWFVIEIVAALGLTPFPAARRVIGTALVMGLLAARAAGRVARAHKTRTPPPWVLAVGVGAGIAVAAIDWLDAFPEKVCAEMAADFTRDRPDTSTVWFVGHWGFQYYCERAGMQPLIPGETRGRAGDFVVLPVYPPSDRFPRPYAGFEFAEPSWLADEVAVFEWDDPLSAKTVPNFYGGTDPVAGRDHPRLRVRVYRLRANWAP